MRIYVSHKRGPNQDLFYEALSSISNHEFIFPHKESQTPFESKELFQTRGCDLILAEVSEPSTGQGIELGWADLSRIPIICVYKTGSKFANSLSKISKSFFEYSDYNNLISSLETELSK